MGMIFDVFPSLIFRFFQVPVLEVLATFLTIEPVTVIVLIARYDKQDRDIRFPFATVRTLVFAYLRHKLPSLMPRFVPLRRSHRLDHNAPAIAESWIAFIFDWASE